MAREPEEWDVIILQALFERADDGMTIFELRNQIEADIDTIGASLERLKERDFIETEQSDGRLTIRPTDAALSMADEEDDQTSWMDRFREWLPF